MNTTRTPAARPGAAVYSCDGARVGTIAQVFRAGGVGPAAPVRYAYLIDRRSTNESADPLGPVCLPASAIASAARGRVTLSLTQDQLVA
jgi:hypothetical protein